MSLGRRCHVGRWIPPVSLLLVYTISNLQHCLGQDCKICPFNDLPFITQPHCCASHTELSQIATLAQTKWLGGSSHNLEQQLLQKTLSLWPSFCQLGCQATPFVTTYYDELEQESVDCWNEQMDWKRWGHEHKKTCNGRLLFEYNHKGKAIVQ